MDTELSELESALLERHLAGCPPCRGWDAAVSETARIMREAPLERPSRRLELARPAAGSRTLRRTLALAAAIAVAGLAALLGALQSGSEGPSPTPFPEISELPPDLLRPSLRSPQERPGPEPRRTDLPAQGAV